MDKETLLEQMLYNGKDIAGLPSLIGKEKEKTTVMRPVRSVEARHEKDYGMEIG